MKHIYERDILPYLPDMLSLIRKVEYIDNGYAVSVLTYLLNVSETEDGDLFFETVQQGLSPETRGNFMTPAQWLEAKGMKKGLEMGTQQGLEKGLEKGQYIAKKQIAQKLLQQGMPIEAVSETIDLPVSELLT